MLEQEPLLREGRLLRLARPAVRREKDAYGDVLAFQDIANDRLYLLASFGGPINSRFRSDQATLLELNVGRHQQNA